MNATSSVRGDVRGDVLVAMPRVVTPVTAVRSTMMCASLLGLAKAGLTERYLDHLPAGQHAEVASLTAGIWVPIELAMSHYRACDALQLSASQIDLLYSESGARLRGTVLSTVLALARAAGATPLLPMRQYPRTWERLFKGGGVGVVRTKDNAAQVEVRGLPLLQIPYYAHGFMRLHEAAYLHFARSVHMTTGRPFDANGAMYNVSWT